MTLKELQIGKSAVVDTVGGSGALRQHFLDMGLIPGAEVTLVKLAPMGDPMELRIHGYELPLRLDDAAQIGITPTEKAPAKKAETKPTGPDMEELKNAFVKNYSRLYQTDDDHESGEFYDAVDKFDEMSANDSQFAATVQKFNKYMGDLSSSDREAAAFVMALDDLEKAKTPEMVPTVQQFCFA